MQSQQKWISDVIWLSFLFFIFYCLWLGSYPLFTPDEGRYSSVAREMLFSHDFITPRLDGIQFLDKPILYYWLQVLAMKLFGVNEWALRFFPMLLGVMNCIVVYIGTRINFNRRSAILASSILATMPLYFSGAHYANLDLEVASFISMTLLFFLSGVSTQRRLFFYLAYCCSAFAFLTKGLIGVAFPAMICGAWIALTHQWQLIKRVALVQGILLFLLIVSPWYIFAQRANPDFFHFFFVTQQVVRFLSAGSFNNENAFWFYLPVILIGAFPWSIFLFQALRLKIDPSRAYLLIWALVVLVFFSIPRCKTVGYIIPILTPLAILIGCYLDQQLSQRSQQFFISKWIFTIVSVALGLSFLYFAIKPKFHFAIVLHYYFYAFSLLFLCASIIAFRLETLKRFIYLCIISNSIFLLILTHSANILNQTTSKPLLNDLYRLRKSNEEVVNYYKFYQDMPLYLGERITLVANWDSVDILDRDNWVRELWFGRYAKQNAATLINDATFLKRWQSQQRLFVFLNANYLHQFTIATKNYYLIRRYNNILLVSNQRS